MSRRLLEKVVETAKIIFTQKEKLFNGDPFVDAAHSRKYFIINSHSFSGEISKNLSDGLFTFSITVFGYPLVVSELGNNCISFYIDIYDYGKTENYDRADVRKCLNTIYCELKEIAI